MASTTQTQSQTRTSSRGKKEDERTATLPSLLAVSVGVFATFAVIWKYQDQIDAYQYVPREGLHHPLTPISAVVAYLVVIYWLIPLIMKNRAPMPLTALKTVHNYILTIFSVVTLTCAGTEIARIWFKNPEATLFWKFEALLCDSKDQHRSGNLYFWFHCYYLSKFYELIDTAFICFTKKKPIFLHVYHHLITLWTMWLSMDNNFTTQWVIVTANCFVHVFMYYYYMLQTVGVSVWWKRYLTTLQICQFMLDEAAILTRPYFVLVAGLQCQSNWPLFFYGCAVVGSVLVLFLFFYIKTYLSKRSSKKE